MKALKKNQDALGAALGKDRSVVSRMLTGEVDISLDHVHVLARELEVPWLEILYRVGFLPDGVMPRIRTAPIISSVEAGRFAARDPGRVPEAGESLLVEHPHDTLFALRVSGDSMDRVAPEGSHIVVDYSDKDAVDGDLFVFARDGDSTFKRYRRSSQGPWLEPDSSNPRNNPIFPHDGETIEVIGRVVEIRPSAGTPIPEPRTRKR